MSAKRKHSPEDPSKQHRPRRKTFEARMGLGAYLEDPASSRAVISYNDDFVAINDAYPKATVHALLIPRSEKYQFLHPFDALEDAEFLKKIRSEAAVLKGLVAKQLQRKLGPYSALDAGREAVLNGEAEPEGDGLPPGRNWEDEVRVGVHSVPSMSHLHIHVISRDMHSDALKHRKHYNSFNTPFFVDLDDFPLATDDPRRDTKKEGYLRWDFKCWRCDKNFGNQFKRLKDHLEEEFGEWKRI